MGALAYALVYVLAGLLAVATALGGAWPLLVPAFVFAALPALDLLVGRDPSDPDDEELARRARDPLYDLLLRAWVPTQLGLLGFAVARVASGDLSVAEIGLLAVGAGVVTGGAGITVAHELVHRKERLDRALAEVLMTSTSYTWFCVEHVLGHHRNVATPLDPATSRLGESVYAFLPRTLIGGVLSAWRLEGERTARRQIPWTSLRDRRTRYGLELVALYAGLSWLGPAVVGFFAVQSLVAVLLLEVVNYVEHYGLLRAEVAPGRYERVRPDHSWNSTWRLTGAFLFNLPRHADHHAWASRPYWQLRAWPGAPELPLGYATMVLVALVPPLWFRWMDPRVAAARARPAAAA